LKRPDYLSDFAAFWSGREEVNRIWFSLYTPQEGDWSEERLTREARVAVVKELINLRDCFPKLDAPGGALEAFLDPPLSPKECIFSQVTACVSADLSTRITPCQFGGHPVCSECGCMASAGMASVGKFKIAGLVPVAGIYSLSRKLSERLGVEPAKAGLIGTYSHQQVGPQDESTQSGGSECPT